MNARSSAAHTDSRGRKPIHSKRRATKRPVFSQMNFQSFAQHAYEVSRPGETKWDNAPVHNNIPRKNCRRIHYQDYDRANASSGPMS